MVIQVNFNKDLGELVDSGGQIFLGKRFDNISVSPIQSFSSSQGARLNVVNDLERKATEHSADAYEIITTSTYDSHQEYDSAPYTASAMALLYKRQ